MKNDPFHIGKLIVLIDSSKMRHVRIKCRCGNAWVEDVPDEVHESTLRMVFGCTLCSAIFMLQDKVLQRIDSQEVEIPKGSWSQSGGNA